MAACKLGFLHIPRICRWTRFRSRSVKRAPGIGWRSVAFALSNILVLENTACIRGTCVYPPCLSAMWRIDMADRHVNDSASGKIIPQPALLPAGYQNPLFDQFA